MRWLAGALLLIWPLSLTAQEALPALYDVARVAADDVLNVRAEPGASAPIVGTLAPDQNGVEVVERNADGTWGRILIAEGTGWVSLAYLDRQAGQEGFPAVHSCTGTEPFWGLWPESGGWLYSSPDGPDHSLDEVWGDRSVSRTDRYGLVLGWEDISASVVLRRELCSDGMSDRLYGLSADVLMTEGGQTRLLTGCCRVSTP